ncbi:hypothetical protein [Haloplanus pelagicus]|jgi:hypothetical protein|uniref:hypothetical protein n=1 Tax=Haloplanus pelagicus TaxID=2949995 RepID=UPI00203E080B|nr:hypothetical protein [Haloplanus sp. HW8-1]
MSLKEGGTEVGQEKPAGVRRYVAEAVCTDCDYAEYRTTTGVTGSFTRCPACGGDLVMPRDAMS